MRLRCNEKKKRKCVHTIFFVIMDLLQNSPDNRGMIISIFHGCMVWVEKSVTRDHCSASLGKPRDAD